MRGTLISLIFVSFALAQDIIYRPTINQPNGFSDIVGFVLNNPTTSALKSQYITFGMHFVPGQLISSTSMTVLTGVYGSSTTPIQLDVRSRHVDNSVKFASLTMLQPALTAGQSLQVMLTSTAATAGSNVDLSTFPASALTVAMTGSNFGDKTYDVSAFLKTKLSSASYWLNGPLASQVRIQDAVSGAMRMVFDITLFKDGSVFIDSQFNNDRAFEKGSTMTYTASISDKTGSVFSAPITQYVLQDWHYEYYSAGLKNVNVQFDIPFWIQGLAFLNYNLSVGIAKSAIDGFQATVNDAGTNFGKPLSKNTVTPYMPGTGGRGDIGALPVWAVMWIFTQNDLMRRVTLANADSSGSVDWNYWDWDNNVWTTAQQHPNIWYDGRCDPYKLCPANLPNEDSGWTAENAHPPILGYTAYLMTSSRWYFDRVQAEATWMVGSCGYRQIGSKDDSEENYNIFTAQQTRAVGWMMRTIDHAAWISPSDDYVGMYLRKVFDSTNNYILGQTKIWDPLMGEVKGWLPFSYGNDDTSPWMNDYCQTTFIMATLRGSDTARQMMAWTKNYIIGRFLNEAKGFNPHNGVAYRNVIGDDGPTTNTLNTWQAVQDATVAKGFDNGQGWAAGNYAQLGLASVQLYLTVYPGDAEATQALNFFYRQSPPPSYCDLDSFRQDPLSLMASTFIRAPINVIATGNPVTPPAITGTPSTPPTTPTTPTTPTGGDIIEFYWTSKAAKRGSCVQINEPQDPNSWDDNFLCALNEDIQGWKWTNTGLDSIDLVQYKCTQWLEASDPDGWDNNYLCHPSSDTRAYAFSAKGVISGMTCVRTREVKDKAKWSDNYWCTAASSSGIVNVGSNGVYNGPSDENSNADFTSGASFATPLFALIALFFALFKYEYK